MDRHEPAARTRANAIANYVGRGWAVAVSLVCLPMFLSLLGREAYGLIGAFAVVQSWALLLDFGLTPTLNREMVRARSGMRSWASLANLIRSIELLSGGICLSIALVLYCSAPALANTWLRPQQLPMQTVTNCISLMGALAAVRWIEQVYRGAIQGSEDQVWLNVIQTILETVRWFGALAVIRFVDANVIWFFVWNLGVSLASISVLRFRVAGLLKQHTSEKPRVSFHELRAVKRFAGGMFLSSVLTFLLTQADKLVVGGNVTLADFGIYALASTAAAGLLQLVQPMSVAVLPRFTALVESGKRDELASAFSSASQGLVAIVLPIGLLTVIFPEQALFVWTGQLEVSRQGATILSLLMLASLLNAMASIPYMLQLAHGWTSLTNKVNGAMVVIALPVLIWTVKTFAGVGAAATLVGLNLASLAIVSTAVLSRLLPSELGHWLRASLIRPIVFGAMAGIGLRLIIPTVQSRLGAALELGVCGTVIGLVVLASLPVPRKRVLAVLRIPQ